MRYLISPRRGPPGGTYTDFCFRKVDLIHTSFEMGLYGLVFVDSCWYRFLHWNMHG